MDGVVRGVNVRVLGKGLELLSANGGRFEINQLLLADDKALVADSEEKLCRLVSELKTVDPIDWSHPPPSWAVPPERPVHSINHCNLSMRCNHLNAAIQGINKC